MEHHEQPSDNTVTKLHGVWVVLLTICLRVGDRYVDPVSSTASGTIMHSECSTLITLASFTVTPFSKAVVLEWTTASEIDNAGFKHIPGRI